MKFCFVYSVLVLFCFTFSSPFPPSPPRSPYASGYHGLGDVTVVIFFGFVATGGMRYVHGGSTDFLSMPTAVASAQVGLLCAVLLAINNLRDVTTDALVGKNTLPVKFGVRFGRWEVTLLLGVPYLLNLYWILLAPGRPATGGAARFAGVGGDGGGGGGVWGTASAGGGGGAGRVRGGCWHAALLTSLTAPLAAHVARRTWQYDPPTPRFNGLLATAALLHLLFGALLAVGIYADDAPLHV